MASEYAKHWTLEEGLLFLNHGSFGACPRVVLEAQSELRARMERNPLKFISRDQEALLDGARAALGGFVHADAEDLVFVPNATTGVNTVIRSLELQAGDELLTTDHAYNACRNALRWHEPRGVRVVAARVPWPIEGPHQVIDAVMGALTPRTKLVLLDHITSPTGLVFPVQALVAKLRERGVDALVDGAHAPGQIPLDLEAIGAAYYTGNCHKWLCTPKGSGFLHVRRDRHANVKPLAIGHGLNSARTDRSRFRLDMDFSGTDDATPFLCIPAALRFLGGLLEGGWPELMRRNHALALQAREVLCRALRVPKPAPDFMLGSLASVPLPDGDRPALQRELFDRHRIEVPIMPFPPGKRLVRVSAQLYNSLDEYAALARLLQV
ncbi:MAG TPA: aminotransferase class V-fold PLP-dependent enzyme [Myxococcales bacterium]|nr:aminotransferase class V-fold PLP-dependent enzyme [Myxococcales bacterium]